MIAKQGQRKSNFLRIVLHLARALIFVFILALIHTQHAEIRRQQQHSASSAVDLEKVRNLFADADSISKVVSANSSRQVIDATGQVLGTILQTSPECDHLIGFSGPTNVLIGLSLEDRIVGIEVLSSGDTPDHVAQILQDDTFLKSFQGLTPDTASRLSNLDGVSGATLTSLAIQESIVYRLSGSMASLRFPDPLNLGAAQLLFSTAAEIAQDIKYSSLWHVKDQQGEPIGSILRTSPTADNLIGYQGPTEAWIGLDCDGRVAGVAIGQSFDNQPYVDYVRQDEYFLTLFNGFTLPQLAQVDFAEAEVEGVSGATMTSQAVAEGLLIAAERHRSDLERELRKKPWLVWSMRDLGTAAVILAGLAVALTRLRGHKSLRLGFQLVLIGYLGFINGDMLSQAMLVGWAQSGVPWRNAGGLVLLTIAALLLPITTRRNVYCTHLCPHGATQELLRNRLPWRIHLSRRWVSLLKMLPGLLLAWCILVAMASLSFSLVDIEPFNAWVFRVAGWATITVALVGLVASMFVPMAYCRYGCPTGALLNFLRLNSHSGQWTRRDWIAVTLLALATGLWWAI